MTELLDRGEELAAGRRLLEAATAERGSLLVVEGVPGIGKSELLGAFRDTARELAMVPVVGRGVEVHRTAPFAVIRAMLGPLVRTRGRSTVRLTGISRHAKGVLDGTDATATPADPGAVLDALYWVVADLAESHPLAVLVDDAHWVDEPSLRLIRFLQPRLEELPVVVILATRPLDPDDEVLGQIVADPTARIVRPGALSEAAVHELVSRTLSGQADTEFTRASIAATGGNPFFLSELLSDLAARGIRPNRNSVTEIGGVEAGGISRALRFRHAGSPAMIAVARALAVLGDGSSLERVAQLANVERHDATVAADALTRRAMVTTSHGLAFAHPIVRGAVYAAIGPSERAAAHGRAAQLLAAAGAPVDEVASHLLHTEPQGDRAVVATLRRAAAEALATGAPDAAVRYLRRAAVEPPRATDRAGVLMALGRAEMMTEDPAAIPHLLEAYGAAGHDRAQRAEIGLACGFALFMAGESGRAMELMADVADSIADRDRDTALRIEAEMGSIAVFEPESAPERQRLERIDHAALDGSVGERMMLALLGYRALLRGADASNAVGLVERALGNGELLTAAGGEATSIAECVMTLVYADEGARAAALIDAAHARVEESGSRHGYAQICFWRSVLANRTGRPAAGAAEAETSLEITRPGGPAVAVVVAAAELVGSLIELGRLEAAEEALRALGMHEGEIPTPAPFNTILSARGRLRLSQGRLDGGVEDLLECGRRKALIGANNPVVMPWAADAALAYRARGNLREARRLAAQEMDAAVAWGTPGAIGAAKRVLGLLAGGDEQVKVLSEAVDDLGRSPARLAYLQTMVDLGAALRRANRRVDARDRLLHALEIANDIGAVRLANEARTELAALGVRIGASQRAFDALTPSELRVARLAATGSSNREIAQALFVTTKTVEKHLANAYSKLGVDSRRELERHLPATAVTYQPG